MNALATQTAGTMTAVPEDDLIRVLQNSQYPGAQIGSVQLVLGYCQAAGLDPMQKPVHIVPMWDKNTRAMRDVIMPGISLYRTQAARTGEHVGTDEPVYGPMIDLPVTGGTVRVPEWCSVTVWRMKSGIRCAFVATEYWEENYAVAGKDTTAPNAMWKKRSRGQIAKCAEAQALRKAFPDTVSSAPTAEEMEGKNMTAEIDITPAPAAKLSQDWLGAVAECKTAKEVTAVWAAGVKEIQAAGDKQMYDRFKALVGERGTALKAAATAPAAEPETDTEETAEPMTDEQIEAADLARTGGQP